VGVVATSRYVRRTKEGTVDVMTNRGGKRRRMEIEDETQHPQKNIKPEPVEQEQGDGTRSSIIDGETHTHDHFIERSCTESQSGTNRTMLVCFPCRECRGRYRTSTDGMHCLGDVQ